MWVLAQAVPLGLGRDTQLVGRRGYCGSVSNTELRTIRAGLVEYQQAWQWQRQLHEQRVAGEIPDTALLLEHPPVFTAGRRTEPFERPVDGTPVIDVDRGGKITWHGPGQLVGYPILQLPDPMDVVAYVRRMERVLIDICAELGLATDQVAGRSGVWVAADERGPDRKVAAIGVRVAQRVTLHGFALNCNPDLSWFDRIVPCGIADAGVTSLTAELGREITVAEVLPVVERHLPALAGTQALESLTA
jgi:lipoyl(octanoyl) transferase